MTVRALMQASEPVRVSRWILWLWLVQLSGAQADVPLRTDSNGTWLHVVTLDNVGPENKTMTGHTNANNLVVYASRFNYTSKVPAIKVMIRGNLDKPSPSLSEPLVASIRNWAGGHTITVPYNVFSRSGRVLSTQDHATRYLCPAEVGELDHILVSVGTGYLNPSNASRSFKFQVTFERIGHWSLKLDEPEKLSIKPTDPAVYAFLWPADGTDTIVLQISSVQAPDVCVSVSVQPRRCPLAQTPAELTVDASFFTMTSRGALAVRRAQFPDGFFLMVVPEVDDVPCDPAAAEVTTSSRQKTVMLTLTPQHSPSGLLALPAVLALLLLLLGVAATRLLQHNRLAPRLDIYEGQAWSASSTLGDRLVTEQEPELAPAPVLAPPQPPVLAPPQPPAGHSAVALLTGGALLLLALCGDATLAALGTSTGAGDLDVCYRNELCSHAVGGVPEVNHLVSFLPYIGAGFGALVTIRAQRDVQRRAVATDAIQRGIAHDWGLLEAIALAMVLQGVLGGLQSVCPGPRSAPLGVALVYFTLTALACKLFQTRRGRTAGGHYAPLLLTAVLVLASLAKQNAGNTWYTWLTVAVVHVAATVVIATQLFVLGEVSLGLNSLKRMRDQMPLLATSLNFRMNRAAFIAALVTNFSLAVAGAAAMLADFTHYAMIFFVLNMALYLGYYLLLKLVDSEERAGRWSLALLAIGATLLLAAVITLAGWSVVNTELPPAASRLLNRACLAGGLFDTHDLWHMLAAPALLCLTLGLLLLDDDLMFMPRDIIPRF